MPIQLSMWLLAFILFFAKFIGTLQKFWLIDDPCCHVEVVSVNGLSSL
jgi:uncharacterized membrane protein YoaT (DUF817 family)